MSDSVGPHRRKPTRLPHPWDSPGKNTGMGCHFLFQCMKVKSLQLCPTLCDPIDGSLPGSSAHGIFPGKSTGVGCHCLLRDKMLGGAKKVWEVRLIRNLGEGEVFECIWKYAKVLTWLEGRRRRYREHLKKKMECMCPDAHRHTVYNSKGMEAT